ncbi:MAG: hypothetical protein M3N98_01050, partial [Actinomycetota bacterium]|nr:hypothetical protein [Actinomycetota bacterium]
MTENEDIPVLNALREKLVAGIAEHPSRRWRRPPVAIAAGVVALAVVAGVLLVAKPGGNAHKVVVG